MQGHCLRTQEQKSVIPKVIDLFSGCGGLTLGFEKAGFDIAAGIELVPEACQTISYNLDYRYGREQTHLCADIKETDTKSFKDRLGNESCIIIGGPPCQAYSIAGRAKLRSLGSDRINTNDSRGYLFQDFLRFVYDLDASAVIMENVPESTNYGGMNVPETVCQSLETHGYDSFWTVLNAADYGVPQIRERVFVIAVKADCGKKIHLPVPSHRSMEDYHTANQKRLDSFSKSPHFRMPVSSEKATKAWVTVGEALSDLPELLPTAKSRYRLVKLNEEMDYRSEAKNPYQLLMRNWYGTACTGSTANAFRNNKRDFPIFSLMKQGDDYISACRIADELFEREAYIYGFKPGTAEYEKLKKKMVPIYDRDQFTRKWVRLCNDKPSHTLVAHLSKDTYSHIHPTEPRGISVREAARIQSFPDDFFFDCSMGDAFRQIGNAVPPLLARAVAECIWQAFKEEI